MFRRLSGLCLSIFLLFGGVVWSEEARVIARVGPYTLSKADFEKEMERNPQLKVLLSLKPEIKEVLVKRWVEVTLFSELARKYSEDPGTRDKGGDLGFFSRGQMVPEFEEVVFKLKVGEISPPIKTRFGYHLVRVEAKIPSREQTYEEVKDRVRQDLLEAKKAQRMEALMAELRRKYPVEIRMENLP